MPRETRRRDEVAQAATDYVLEHGLIGLSLRPLAAELGTSDRMLLYHFESKDDLVAAVLRVSNDRSAAEVRALTPAPDPRRAVLALWQALRAPRLSRCQRVYVEAAALGLFGREPYVGVLREANAVWSAAVADYLVASGAASTHARRAVELLRRRDDGVPARPAPGPQRPGTGPCGRGPGRRGGVDRGPGRRRSGERVGVRAEVDHESVVDQPPKAALALVGRRPGRVETAAVHRLLAVAEQRQQPPATLPVGAVVGLRPPGGSVVRRVAGRAPLRKARPPGSRRNEGSTPSTPPRRAPWPPPTKPRRSGRRREAGWSRPLARAG